MELKTTSKFIAPLFTEKKDVWTGINYSKVLVDG